MKIRDKRSAYFYLDNFANTYPNLYFAYVDETPGGVEGLLYEGLKPGYGVKIYDQKVVKVDAERPFLLFTGAEYGGAPDAPNITSSIGATYTTTANMGDSGDGSAARILPGLKCGDFVKIAKP